MRVVLQRVTEARVIVDKKNVGEIDRGLLVLFCAEQGDTVDDAAYFAGKIAKMRVFADENGKTNLSIKDIGGAVLAISQFTLAAEWRKGNRPGFSRAAPPEEANNLYVQFCSFIADQDIKVERGIFAADMKVELINDGPFTIVMDGKD